MTIALVTGAFESQGGSANGVTSEAIDTTSVNFITVGVAWYPGSSPNGTLTDSKGNTWIPRTTKTHVTTFFAVRILYCQAPTVGSGHTFDYSATAIYPSIQVAGFSGVASSPYDVEGSGEVSGDDETFAGSVTPGENNELIITVANIDDNPAVVMTIDNGFTITGQAAGSAGNFQGSALAYLVQTTAATVNPKWTTNGWNTSLAAVDATFKAAASGATADLSATLGATAISSDAAVAVVGNLSSSLANASLSSDAAVAVVANLSATLENIALSSDAAALATRTADLAVTFADTSISSAGAVAIVANLSTQLEGEDLDSDASVAVVANLSATLESVSISSAGGAGASVGDSSATLADTGISATGAVAVVTALAATLESISLSADGTSPLPRTAELSVTLENVSIASTGTNDSPVVIPDAVSVPVSGRRRRAALRVRDDISAIIAVTGRAIVTEAVRDIIVARGQVIDLEKMLKEHKRLKVLQILALAA